MSEIKGSQKQTDDLFEILESEKMFVYQLPNIKRNTAFLKNNSHATIQASTDVLTDWKKQELEVVITTTDGEQIRTSSGTSSNAKELKREKILSIWTNDYIAKIDNTKIYIATIGKPLDPAAHYRGDQQVYYLSDITPTESTPSNISGLLDPKNVAEITARDFDLIEAQYINAEVQFSLSAYSPQDINRIVIDIQKQTLLNSIQIKGEQANGLSSDVKIDVSDENLAPLRMNPTEVQEKLTMYSPWFNHDFSLPFAFAKLFTQANKLSATISREAERKALLDMILLTYAYASDYSFVEYITSGNDAGKIKGNQYIGWDPKQASSLASKDPKKMISSIYEKYLRDFPQTEISREIRILNQHISALSRWINSTKAIRGGNNSFNKIFLPFTLRIFESLKPVKRTSFKPPIPGGAKVQSWTLSDDDTKFVLESLYFGFSQQMIVLDRKIKLSEIVQLQADVKYNLPSLPEIINPIEHASLPNEVSDDDLKYLFYVKVDPSKLQKFYGISEQIDTTTPVGTEITTAETAFADYGKVYPNNQAGKRQLFHDLGYSQQFVSATNVETLYSEERQEGKLTSTRVITNPHLPSLSETKTLLANKLNVSPDSLVINHREWSLVGTETEGDGIDETTFDVYDLVVRYKISHARLLNLRYITKSQTGIQESLLDRKTQFDKYEWKKQIDGFSIDPANPESKYSITPHLDNPITKLKEIDVHSLWGEEITFHLGGSTITFNMFNKNDETIGIERFLFL